MKKILFFLAVTGGALTPILTLGIQGNATTAVLLGWLMIHGLLPGNDLFTKQANITYAVMVGMFFANLFFLVVSVTCAKYFAQVPRTPIYVLAPLIIVLCVVGSFTIKNALFDVHAMFAFGVLGFVLRKYGFDVTPMVLGLILGPIAENGLAQAIQIKRGLGGALASIFTSPICLVLLAASILSIAAPLVREWRDRRREKNSETA